MTIKHKHVYIISDIEGSSGCWNYGASTFLHADWPQACFNMSRDVNAVVKELFKAGVEKITVKDFHRTAYNLIPDLIDHRAKVVSGYVAGPIPGIGEPGDATALMMIGMHAPSGSDGFLAHTLTSRISRLEVNGKLMSEAQLFSSSMAPFGLVPIFFSGCPVACDYAGQEIEGIRCCPIDKTGGRDNFDIPKWRRKLAQEAATSLLDGREEAYSCEGPFQAAVEMRDGPKTARKAARRWRLECEKSTVFLQADDIHFLYRDLIRLCYLTPLVERVLPFGLSLFNLRGKYGLWWAKRKRR